MSDFDRKMLENEADKIMNRIYDMKQDQRSRFNLRTILFSILTFLIISVTIYLLFSSIVSNDSKRELTFETENRYEYRVLDDNQSSVTDVEWFT